MNRAFLSVASNIRPEENIHRAITKLMESSKILSISRCFVTKAIAGPNRSPTDDLPEFINCVALVETPYRARELKYTILRAVEQDLGRVRTEDKYAPRPIDLDILLFNDEIYAEDGLTIPDPDILRRWFLTQGLLDIEFGLILPGANAPFHTQLSGLPGLCIPADCDIEENKSLRRDICTLIGLEANP